MRHFREISHDLRWSRHSWDRLLLRWANFCTNFVLLPNVFCFDVIMNGHGTDRQTDVGARHVMRPIRRLHNGDVCICILCFCLCVCTARSQLRARLIQRSSASIRRRHCPSGTAPRFRRPPRGLSLSHTSSHGHLAHGRRLQTDRGCRPVSTRTRTWLIGWRCRELPNDLHPVCPSTRRRRRRPLSMFVLILLLHVIFKVYIFITWP